MSTTTEREVDFGTKAYIGLASFTAVFIGLSISLTATLICLVVLVALAAGCWAMVRARMIGWEWAALPTAFAVLLVIAAVRAVVT